MSGTGKSTALAELNRLGFDTVDTDEPGWTIWSDEADGYVWDEDGIAELLAAERSSTLFVSGTVSNQGRFYDRFDAVVLLSARAEVLLADRTADRQPLRQGAGGARPRAVSSRRGRAAPARHLYARGRCVAPAGGGRRDPRRDRDRCDDRVRPARAIGRRENRTQHRDATSPLESGRGREVAVRASPRARRSAKERKRG
jgi:hypothetical protein